MLDELIPVTKLKAGDHFRFNKSPDKTNMYYFYEWVNKKNRSCRIVNVKTAELRDFSLKDYSYVAYVHLSDIVSLSLPLPFLAGMEVIGVKP